MMKKISLLSVCLLFLFTTVMAQNVPSGMKYQAVARGADGEILALKNIGLEIQLLKGGSDGVIVFSETYQVTTNILGLFSITIGEGRNETGTLTEVPWSSSEIWMNIGVDEKGGTDFATIATTKLLTVPYAFHAGTAENIVPRPIVEKQEQFPEPSCIVDPCSCVGGLTEIKLYYFGEDGVEIEVYGNSLLTNLIANFSGINKGDLLTIDGTNTSIGTLFSNTYMRVINGNGESCIVKFKSRCPTNVWPGALDDNEIVGKSFGDFIVFSRTDEQSSTECSVADRGQDWRVGGNIVDASNTAMGTRNNEDVTFISNDKVGAVLTKEGDFDFRNNVDLNTLEGETRSHGDFTVTNLKSTLLSGTLTVDLATDLNAALNVDGPSNLQSSLNVNNNSSTTLSGTLLAQDNSIFNQHVLLDNATLGSNDVSEGALVVNGGVGIGQNLNVGGDGSIGGGLELGGALEITDVTESTSTGTGALIVAGGVGIGKRLNVGGVTEIDAAASGSTALIVKSNVATGSGANPLTSAGQHIANFENTADGNGISIKLGAATPHNNNNFITFFNSNNETVGRIEGEDSDDNSDDFERNREYKDAEAFLITDIAFATLDITIAGLESVQAGIDVTAAATSSTACAGLGACVTAPIPSFIVAKAAALALKLANAIALGGNLVETTANLVVFRDTHKALEGITLASGAEDYAEYLPRLNQEEAFMPGDIVGVKNGYITKNTNNAEMIMVISLKPVVLGGLPRDGDISKLEKVAFMGQVSTKVIGEVNPGDYILASGFHTGFGIAKNPDKMTPQDYKNILGVAWEGKESEEVGYVNTAIGLNSNDMADLFQQQSKEISDLKTQIAETNDILAKLVPGFAEAVNMDVSQDDNDGHNHVAGQPLSQVNSGDEGQFVHSTADQIVYFPIDRKYLEEGLQLAMDNSKKVFEEAGLDINDHPFWNRIITDLPYKEQLLGEMEEKLNRSFHTHKLINERIIEKN